jgi:pimeloyl-ACP methyl ester carboxylesterase
MGMSGNGAWRFVRRSALILVAVIAAFIVSLATYLALPISTPPFRDADGHILPGSIASIERWRLNGIDQSVILRGRSASNPILVWVHGGPGTSETPFFRHYNAPLEDHFLVVYWDQRYAGQSLDPFGPKPTHERAEDYVEDLGALVERLCARFHRRKVVLVAHSAGTVPALLYTERHPERVAAYIGIGQVANTPESEARSYAFVLEAARRHSDADVITRLGKMGPPPWKEDFTPRDLIAMYGGAFHANIGLSTLAMITLRSNEANWRDVAALLLVPTYNKLAMQSFHDTVLDADHTRFSVPIFFVSGRYDRVVDASLAYRYLGRVFAPSKQFVWFENSAHGPPFEEPERFNAWVISAILPIAQAR